MKPRYKLEITDPYLTVQEAAEYIRVDRTTIEKMIRDGTMVLNKHYFRPKAIRAVRIKKSALDELMTVSSSEAE